MVMVVMVWLLPVLTPWLLPVWFQGSPESGGYQIFWKMCPYPNVFTIFVESEDYQMNVNMNIDWQWPKITKLKKCLFGGLGSH